MNPLLDTLGWLGSSLDKPGAAVRGLLAGRPDQLANLIPFSDTMGLTDPTQRTEGADLVGLDRDSTGGMLGGMAVNVATDPLNWLMGAGLAKNLLRGRQMEGAYQAAHKGYEGELAARQALMPAMEKAQANNALRQELLGTGGMPEEVAQLTKAVDAEGNPVRTYHGTASVYGKFDPAMDRGHNLYGPGYYSTEEAGVANGYSGQVPDLRPQYANDPDLFMNELRARVAGLDPAEKARQLRRMDSIRSTAIDPPDELLQLQGHFATAGDAFADLYQPNFPHVRMQHLDVRNPLDLERNYSRQEVSDLAARLPGRGQFINDALDTASFPMHGETLYHTLTMGDPARVAFGNEKALLNQELQQAGFDAIQHLGGGGTHQVHIVHGPEQIYSPWVAPLQMAEPALPGAYPPARPVPPRVSPLIASLLGQNTLGRAG